MIMKQQNRREETTCRPGTALHMPQQTPPVDRSQTAAAGAAGTTPGTEANIVAPPFFDWDSKWTARHISPYIVS